MLACSAGSQWVLAGLVLGVLIKGETMGNEVCVALHLVNVF